MYNQMLYFQSLFDVERVGKEANSVNGVKVEGEAESREKMKVLAEVNRERLGTLKGVVAGWLERNGRQWVQMDRLFGFAMKR
jgi:DNA polymerase alpha subunit A